MLKVIYFRLLRALNKPFTFIIFGVRGFVFSFEIANYKKRS